MILLSRIIVTIVLVSIFFAECVKDLATTLREINKACPEGHMSIIPQRALQVVTKESRDVLKKYGL